MLFWRVPKQMMSLFKNKANSKKVKKSRLTKKTFDSRKKEIFWNFFFIFELISNSSHSVDDFHKSLPLFQYFPALRENIGVRGRLISF